MDKIAKKLKLTVKSNVVSHTLGLISVLYEKKLDMLEIWDNKDVPQYLLDLIISYT